jgi:hypothetical protein
MFKDIKVEEILVYLMLIVVGYYIAKMFSRSCNGFSVGGSVTCMDKHRANILYNNVISCPGNKQLINESNDIPSGTTFENYCCQ